MGARNHRVAPRRPVVIAIVFALAKRPAIVAFFRGDHAHDNIGPEPPPSSQEVAARLRHDAIGLCEQGARAACKDKLDEAASLDPADEADRSAAPASRHREHESPAAAEEPAKPSQ
jgi:hypothetical protein